MHCFSNLMELIQHYSVNAADYGDFKAEHLKRNLTFKMEPYGHLIMDSCILTNYKFSFLLLFMMCTYMKTNFMKFYTCLYIYLHIQYNVV